jgi:ABC-type Na+ transport system ATPase subunit NatA
MSQLVPVIEIGEEVHRLRREVRNHPKLYERIVQAQRDGVDAQVNIFSETADKDIVMIRSFEEWIGFLAAEFDIVLNGTYTAQDIYKLCDIIRVKLEERRTVVIGSSPIILLPGTKLDTP